MDRRTDGLVDERTDGWMEGWLMEGCTDGWMDGGFAKSQTFALIDMLRFSKDQVRFLGPPQCPQLNLLPCSPPHSLPQVLLLLGFDSTTRPLEEGHVVPDHPANPNQVVIGQLWPESRLTASVQQSRPRLDCWTEDIFSRP